MKIAIVEDIKEIRESYHLFLSNQKEIDEVKAFVCAEDFLLELNNEWMPNVVLMDIGLPGISGIECIHHLKQNDFAGEIIMLTVYDDATRIFNSLCAGATGYLLKNTPLRDILDAILQINQGLSPMDPSIARRVVEYFNPKKSNSDQLTQKESEITDALSDGLSYKLIADRLNISINTVRQHIRSIYKKLQVHSKAEVIALTSKGRI